MNSYSLIPADDLLLKHSIEAGASLEALAKGNKKIPNKRKGGSICISYYRTRRRIKFESFNPPNLSFFDRCKGYQDHVMLNHESQVGDVMFGDCLTNNLGSIATADLVDKLADGRLKSIQNDYMNGSETKDDGLYKHTENVGTLVRDNLMDFFDPGMELKDDTHMHKGETDTSSVVTEVGYASPPDSVLSFSDKYYMVCSLNTEDTIDDIPSSQLLDSPVNVLEDPSFDGDEHDVCHCEDDVVSKSVSHLDPVQLSEGEIICSLNTEDPEIPWNDNILLLIYPSSSLNAQLATNLIDLASSFTQSQMDGPDLSYKFESAHPHVGNTLNSVSMDRRPISDHNSDSDLPYFLGIEDPEMPCNDNSLLLFHQSPPIRPQTSTDSTDPSSSVTPAQMDDTYLSFEIDSACILVDNTPKSVSMDHNPSISDHNCDSVLLCLPDIKDPEMSCPSVRPQTTTDSIDPPSPFTPSHMDVLHLSSEFESAHSHVGSILKSLSLDNIPSVSYHNCDSDLPGFPDIKNPDIPSPSVRPQSAMNSIDPASSFTQSKKNGPHLSLEFDSAHIYVDSTQKSPSVDHNPTVSDHNCDSNLPCFPDIEDPETPFTSVRPQTTTDSIDPASYFTQSQMDGSHVCSAFDSALSHVDCTLNSVSVDHNSCASDHNSDNDSDLPCFLDIEALILKLDFEYAQESWITNEVKRHKYKHSTMTKNRPDQSSSQRTMSSLGAFAVLTSQHFNYFIKKTEVTIGRSTDDTEVDIDLRKESHSNMISRQQAIIKMETDGTFTLTNIGKGSILVKGKPIDHGQVAALGSGCLIQIRGMGFMFEINDRYVGWYLDNIIQKTHGKFRTFEWSMNCM